MDGEIAGFRIESEIGRGGMGVVYIAAQSFPERRVALKVLSPELASDEGFRERFIRESNAAASIEHPNIVPVYAAGEADGHLYLAMRYVEGTDLGSLIAHEGPLDSDRAARICAAIADALEAAHERGLVHRDVKPGNVLLDTREHAYLSDFGLIKPTRIDTELTKTGQFMGSLEYVAPEQIRGEPVDGRADLYSLGCVLCECLTGQPPFHRENEVATLYAHLEEPAPVPSAIAADVPRLLDAVVERSMAKRPEDRFATAGAMADALRGESIRAQASGRRWLVGAMAAIFLAATTVIVVSSDGSDVAPSPPPTGATRSAPIPGSSVVKLDADSGQILSITTDAVPAVLAELPQVEVGEDAVWVLRGQFLNRLTPDETAVIEAIDLFTGSFQSDGFAVGYRTVWVGAPPGVVRIDPIDNDQLRPVRLYPPNVFNGAQVSLGASSAWAVTGDGVLTRIDPTSGRRTGTLDLHQGASGIGVGFGGVWVIDELAGTLTRVQPGTLDADEPVLVGGSPEEIAVGAGAVWLLDSGAGVVTTYDPSSGRIGSPIRVGLGPTDITTGLGVVWVVNREDRSISRIDPVTRRVETIPVGTAPGAAPTSIAVDEATRSLWVAIAELVEDS